MSATPHIIAFADATPAQQATVAALETLGVNNHALMSDGSVHVNGTLDISNYGLVKLPDLSLVHVNGSFMCNDNDLTTLKGAPQFVSGDFQCQNNQLTSLEGAPKCVEGDFCCQRNELQSLEHAPHHVGGSFLCSDNQLRSLEGSPRHVGRQFCCEANQLASLEGVTRNECLIFSDFGAFRGWDAIGDQLKLSKQEFARMIEDAARAAVKTTAPVVLKGLSIGGIKRCGR